MLVQVLLRHQADREPLVYACSWWKAGEVGQYLKDSSKPIWVSLSQERMELHRDIHFISLGHSSKLEERVPPRPPECFVEEIMVSPPVHVWFIIRIGRSKSLACPAYDLQSRSIVAVCPEHALSPVVLSLVPLTAGCAHQ